MNLWKLTVPTVLLLLAPSVLGGSAAAPELRDAAGDADIPALDVISAWWTDDAEFITLTIKVADLASVHPLTQGAYRHYYDVQFAVSTLPSPFSTTVTIYGAETSSTTGVSAGTIIHATPSTGIGNTVTSTDGNQRSFRSTVGVDLAESTITIAMNRTYNVNSAPVAKLAPGTVLTGLSITTSTGANVFSVESGLLRDIVGPGRTQQVDTTGVGAPYTLR